MDYNTYCSLDIALLNLNESTYDTDTFLLNIPFEDIKIILKSEEFAKYVSLLKKYKSGGYYTFNSKDVQQYINYYITYKSEKEYVDQSSFFGEDSRLF